ncbi:MAG: hypothetical protein KAR06_04830 [Deltaproteobacteria bacterium]|nr:hypothetical protein [Deltaproteobacteria bacterium]
MADQAKRTKVQVISVGTPKEVGTQGAKVTQFKGIDQTTNEEVVFECWSAPLLEHIIPETVIDVDVIHSVNETSSGIYTHDKITQVYIDGKPVKSKGSWQGRGGDSPETRASIEGQNAATNVCNLIIADKLAMDTPLAKKVLTYLSNKLDAKVAPAQPTSTSAKPTVKKPPVKDEVTPTLPRATADQCSSLRRLAKEQSLDLKQLVSKKGWKAAHLEDLSTDQAQVLIDDLTEIPF